MWYFVHLIAAFASILTLLDQNNKYVVKSLNFAALELNAQRGGQTVDYQEATFGEAGCDYNFCTGFSAQ